MKENRVLHCWADEASQYEFGSDTWAEATVRNGTCILPAGHEGPHVFTPGDEVIICFASADEAVIAEH